MSSKVKKTKIRYILDRNSFFKDLRKKLEKFKIYSEEIYVFGSFVKGNPRIDSDIDILFVIPNEMVSKRHILREKILDELFPVFFPVDLIMLTRDEFEFNKNSGGIKHIVKKGVLLWKEK